MGIETREFGNRRSVQHPDRAVVSIGPASRVTYTLDVVTERGAVLRVQSSALYSTHAPEVGWIVVKSTSNYPSPIYSTRRSARKAIGA